MNDLVAAIGPVIDAFDELGVTYRIGGSVASSVLGVPRSTLDVDVVCNLVEAQIPTFVTRLEGAYYADAHMIREAIQRRDSFNVIHLATMLKVDVFVTKRGAYDTAAFARCVRRTLDIAADARLFDVTSPEDIILRKLAWYRLGGGISERQWSDVLGVLRIQGEVLDMAYVHRWAGELALSDLLERALREASQ